MEVELDWLTPESEDGAKKAAGRKVPPPIPGARVHAPPMPVKPSLPSMRAAPVKELLRPSKPTGKPIPREEEDHDPPPRARPPSLPPRRSKA